MTDTAFLVEHDVAPLIGALLVLVHGWAWISHTDATLELRRDTAICYPCPECEQDRARV